MDTEILVKRKKKVRIIAIIFFGSILTIGLIDSCYEKADLKSNGVYVIGTSTTFKRDHFNRCYLFEYSLNHKNYKSYGAPVGLQPSEVYSKRFFLRISTKNPLNIEAFYYCQVPDSITQSPPNGWKELPISCD